jgi:cytochrome c
MRITRFFLFIGALIFSMAPVQDAFAGKGNPCAVKKPSAPNPCGANPCAKAPNKPIRATHITDYKKLVTAGERLWNDEKLGASGFSCMTCHADYENLKFGKVKGWPRFVKMTGDIVTLDQMINYCMMNPMEANPLDPNSIEMTAMAAYYRRYAAGYGKP